MLTTSVEDPSKYGVVVTNEEGKALHFFEKPKEFVSNLVNAGLYIFNISMLDKIELRPHFLEREIFPKMIANG
jgi:mannose-1-phosphate guanylyltransferase